MNREQALAIAREGVRTPDDDASVEAYERVYREVGSDLCFEVWNQACREYDASWPAPAARDDDEEATYRRGYVWGGPRLQCWVLVPGGQAKEDRDLNLRLRMKRLYGRPASDADLRAEIAGLTEEVSR